MKEIDRPKAKSMKKVGYPFYSLVQELIPLLSGTLQEKNRSEDILLRKAVEGWGARPWIAQMERHNISIAKGLQRYIHTDDRSAEAIFVVTNQNEELNQFIEKLLLLGADLILALVQLAKTQKGKELFQTFDSTHAEDMSIGMFFKLSLWTMRDNVTTLAQLFSLFAFDSQTREEALEQCHKLLKIKNGALSRKTYLDQLANAPLGFWAGLIQGALIPKFSRTDEIVDEHFFLFLKKINVLYKGSHSNGGCPVGHTKFVTEQELIQLPESGITLFSSFFLNELTKRLR